MIKKILVTQDGSRHAASALEYGLWLSRKFDASLIGLHVVDIVSLEGPFLHDISGALGFEPFLNFSTRMREALEAKGRSLLSTFEESCASSGVKCETHLAFGVVVNEICEKAKIADLVIVGRRGVNAGFEYGLLGSATEGVIRKSPEPVLVVPEAFHEPKKPLLAYDGSVNASRAMHAAAEWAKTLSLPLTVVNASAGKGAAKFLQDAEGYMKPYGVNASFVQLENDPPSSIEDYYRDKDHDLLFMGTSRHSKIFEMVLGSTTEHLMRTVEGPFFLER